MAETNLTAQDKALLMNQRKAHLLHLLRLNAPDFLIITHCLLLVRGYCGEDKEKAAEFIKERM